MEINAEAFWVQKAGSSVSEYEDAFYPLAEALAHASRFAISDGATDSSFSGIWARILVKAFVESGPDNGDFNSILSEIQPKWAEQVGIRELPWYAEQKAEAGAFASLLGLSILEKPDLERRIRWHAWAIGDSCLVQVRDDKATARFPLDHSSRFDSAPFLVPSNPRYNEKVSENIARAEGDARTDDSFYMMTDALACWFMAEDERGRAPWRALRDLNTADQRESFEEMVNRLRAERKIKNDDCTLIRIDIL